MKALLKCGLESAQKNASVEETEHTEGLTLLVATLQHTFAARSNPARKPKEEIEKFVSGETMHYDDALVELIEDLHKSMLHERKRASRCAYPAPENVSVY